MPSFAALRAAVFPLSPKNLRGGRISAPPSVCGLIVTDVANKGLKFQNTAMLAYTQQNNCRYDDLCLIDARLPTKAVSVSLLYIFKF